MNKFTPVMTFRKNKKTAIDFFSIVIVLSHIREVFLKIRGGNTTRGSHPVKNIYFEFWHIPNTRSLFKTPREAPARLDGWLSLGAESLNYLLRDLIRLKLSLLLIGSSMCLYTLIVPYYIYNTSNKITNFSVKMQHVRVPD